ncbi:MAG TPA: AraC family transcriptional regulator [Firmicutes bacterium]|nr:AraC family transcriptional regulator [Bacillota bacterium]
MNTVIQKIQGDVRDISFAEGGNQTGIPYVTAWRFTSEKIQMPKIENPYLYIVLDGMLRLYTPSGIMDYMAGQYSISKIDTPLSGTVLTFSEQQDFLALSIEFTTHDIITAVLDLDNDLIKKIMGEDMEEQEMSISDLAVIQSVDRLFCAMNQTVRSEFLRKNIMQEVIYYVLCGSCGKQFLESTVNIGQSDEIYEANSWIKENFRNPFTVEELAGQRNMSVSLFHQKFKSAVGMGPLQCQKRLRLTEARRLMLDESKNVTEASAEVGYESLSQFIRDYRKMFGRAPKEDIRTIQKRLKK